MAKLLACVAAIICLLPVPADSFNWDQIMSKTRPALLHVRSPEGSSCTGFVVGSKGDYVITANHCLGSSAIMRVDGIEVNVLIKSLTQDLALLRNDRLSHDRLKLSVNTQLTDLVLAGGYAHGWAVPIFIEDIVVELDATIPHVGAGFIIVRGANRHEAVHGGMSGGPVINIKGEIVGIVQVGSSEDRQMGMRPSAAIMDFVRTYEDAKK